MRTLRELLQQGTKLLRRVAAPAIEAKVLLLQAKIGELTMENELLRDKADRLDAQLPLARRRSRP